MLFNSYIFILLFLPVVVIAFRLAQTHISLRVAISIVILGSLIYYAYCKVEFLALLVGSVLVNYAIGWVVMARRLPIGRGLALSEPAARALTAAGIVFNLALLGYYKYAGFLVTNANGLFGADLPVPDVVLPIGISFFTFQQIAFLADAYSRTVRDNSLTNYGFFVTFFPQLIAGPIVHHSEVMPQLAHLKDRDARADLSIGTAIFVVGLFKKVVIADSLAIYADAGYGVLATGGTLSTTTAWVVALAYCFQLYFDFSGYSDMAVGLARMFGIRLPVNFYSPYKAASVTEFWRRWHITLSRFLRDYLYFPLGGNRRGPMRQLFNLVAVMFLGGLWHGAAWTFVVWGLVHGAMLAINHLWTRLGPPGRRWPRVAHVLGVAATFLGVTLAWVPFRALDLAQAGQMLAAMLPVTGTADLGWRALPAEAVVGALPAGVILGIAAAVAFFLPNTYQIFARFDPALGLEAMPDPTRGALRRLGQREGVILGLMLALSLLAMQRVSPFLYFQF